MVAVIPFLSEPVDPADALAVPVGVAVEHAVGGEAPQVEVQVVLPGEADAAVHLEALLGELRARVAGVGLGDARDLRRRGARRRRRRRPRRPRAAVLTSAQKLMSARMCLSAWKEPIGRPNAIRALEYSTVISASWRIAPIDSATVSATATSSWASTLACARPGAPSTASAGTDTESKRTSAKRRVRSSPSSGVTVTPGADGVDHELGDAAVAAAGVGRAHEEEVGARTLGHETERRRRA